MCWACEQDRFWAAYAEYMAAKETQARSDTPIAQPSHGRTFPPAGEGGKEPAAEPATELSAAVNRAHD